MSREKDQREWDQFQEFAEAGVAHVNAKRPGLMVGISVGFGNIDDKRVAKLTRNMNAKFLTYYFLGAKGTPTKHLPQHFDKMIAFSGNKALILKEFGYPTGPATGGTVAQQAEFVESCFASWDRHASQIPMIMFSRMFDGNREGCVRDSVHYGMVGNESFIQFVCTLGMRTYESVAKPAWNTLASEAAKRGFRRP